MAIHQPAHQPTWAHPHLVKALELAAALDIAVVLAVAAFLVISQISASLFTRTVPQTQHLLTRGIEYTGIPYPASVGAFTIDGSHGFVYTGIPYPAR